MNYVYVIFEARSRKYQGVFKVKSRVKTWHVRKIWSHQLEYKQVPKRWTEPGVRKGKRSLLASHTRCKCSMETTHYNSLFGEGQGRYKGHEIGGKSDRLGSHCLSRVRMSINIRERVTSYYWIRSLYRPYNFLNEDFKRSTRYPCLSSLLESRLAMNWRYTQFN